MPKRIGPKRLQHLIATGIDLRTLELEQRFQAFRTMGRLLLAPPARTPKRARPRCGARCRDGHRCQAKAGWDKDYDCPVNGRCRLHGGLSTGPRTLDGRRRIGEAARQRGHARRLARAQAEAQAHALREYQAAVAKYEALRQQDMAAFPGLKDAMRQVQAS